MRKKRGFQIARIWRRIFQNHLRNNKDKNLKKIFTVILFAILLCSCQKKPQVTIYMGQDSVQNPIEGLQVKNGDYQAALLRCQERLQQFQEDSIEAVDVYSLMGDIYADYAGDREKAVYYIEKAIEIHQRTDDEIGLALDYVGMAEISFSIDGKNEEGLDYLEKAEEFFRNNGLIESSGLAAILSRKGELYKQMEQYENSLKAFQEAQEIHIKRQEESSNIHLFTGQTYIEMQEYKLAEQEYLAAKRICQENKDLFKEADANWALGMLYVQMEDYKNAIELYEKSLKFYKTDPIYLRNEASIYSKLAYAYNHSGNLEQAFEPAINASRIMENIELDTNDKKEGQKIYKHNLSMYYKGWTDDMSEEGYENWYQNVVIDEEDWREQ